jgi:hypothetical protein
MPSSSPALSHRRAGGGDESVAPAWMGASARGRHSLLRRTRRHGRVRGRSQRLRVKLASVEEQQRVVQFGSAVPPLMILGASYLTSLRSIRARSQRLEIHGTPAFAPAGDGGGGQEKFVVGATMRGAGRESRLARVARTRTRAAPGEREPLRTRTRLSRRAQGRGRSGCGHRPPKVAKAGTRTRRHAAASAAQTAETCGVQARVEPAGAPYLHCLPRHDRDRCGVLDGHWPHGVARHVTRHSTPPP